MAAGDRAGQPEHLRGHDRIRLRPRHGQRDDGADTQIAQLSIKTAGRRAAVTSLSGGNQQKCILGRWLLTQPRVLLLDEPTRGIDVGAKAEVFALMAELLEHGMAIVLVSSEMLEILGLADRIFVMHEQTVVGELSREEATEERIAFLSAGGGRRVSEAA